MIFSLKFNLAIVLAASVATFGGHSASALEFQDEIPADLKDQMLNDLAFVSSIQGSSVTKLHQDVFGAIEGTQYRNFFEARILSVGLDSCGGGPAVACVNSYIPHTMWLTENYTKFSHPQIARLMVVFHEARHAEKKFATWPHANCPRPFLDENKEPMKSIWTGAPLAGEPACDKTPIGSYGSSAIMLKNIQKFCTTCTEKVRADAGLFADNQVLRITNPAALAAIKKDLGL